MLRRLRDRIPTELGRPGIASVARHDMDLLAGGALNLASGEVAPGRDRLAAVTGKANGHDCTLLEGGMWPRTPGLAFQHEETRLLPRHSVQATLHLSCVSRLPARNAGQTWSGRSVLTCRSA